MNIKILEDSKVKFVRSEKYNYNYDKDSGFFARWGVNAEDDPQFAPGPEIADIEITTKCGFGCSYCYKSNTSNGKNMSFETFKKLIEKINTTKLLTQVAFGLGATAEENPDLWLMCDWLRENRIVPNGTVADIVDSTADKIASVFGACAVSYHGDKDACYNSIKKLTDRGLTQTNMHFVMHSDNYDELMSVVKDIKTDVRLEKLNAIVLLSLKTKGRAESGFRQLSQDKFNEICEVMIESKVTFGMDSCSSHKYYNFIENTKNLTEKEKADHKMYVEPCESFAIFSSYFSVDAEYFPCSFAENLMDGIDVLNCNDFVKDVWNGEIMRGLRNKSLSCNRDCILYKI